MTNKPQNLSGKSLVIFPVLVQFVLFIGCSVSPSQPDVSEDFDRQAQEQLLEEAQKDFDEGRDTQAINKLNQFFSLSSPSPMEGEARWLLAKSYERSGKLRAALKQYQIISRELPAGKKQTDVLNHMKELEQRIAGVRPQSRPMMAVRSSVSRLSLLEDEGSTFNRLKQEGVTKVLIEVGCPRMKVRKFPSSVRPIEYTPPEQWPPPARTIHQYGLQAFVGLNLRCLGYVDPRSKKQWVDGFYNPEAQKVQASQYFDIFHPQYQMFLVHQIMKLSDSGFDGVVFLADAPMGLYDGLTPSSVRLFNAAFRTRLNPQSLFPNGRRSPTSKSSSPSIQNTVSSPSEESDFWRWAGWKARQRLSVLQRLMDKIREQNPEFSFGLELHPESIENPIQALTQFSEDFFEANQKSFTFFLVAPQSTSEIQSGSNSRDVEIFMDQTRSLVSRMTLVINNPSKIWISIPRFSKHHPKNMSDPLELGDLPTFSRIYDLQAFLDK